MRYWAISLTGTDPAHTVRALKGGGEVIPAPPGADWRSLADLRPETSTPVPERPLALLYISKVGFVASGQIYYTFDAGYQVPEKRHTILLGRASLNPFEQAVGLERLHELGEPPPASSGDQAPGRSLERALRLQGLVEVTEQLYRAVCEAGLEEKSHSADRRASTATSKGSKGSKGSGGSQSSRSWESQPDGGSRGVDFTREPASPGPAGNTHNAADTPHTPAAASNGTGDETAAEPVGRTSHYTARRPLRNGATAGLREAGDAGFDPAPDPDPPSSTEPEAPVEHPQPYGSRRAGQHAREQYLDVIGRWGTPPQAPRGLFGGLFSATPAPEGEGDRRERLKRLDDAERGYGAGARAEEAVGYRLERLGLGYFVFHDLGMRDRDGKVRRNLDHAVIGPGGVFVIETKNYAGLDLVRTPGEGGLEPGYKEAGTGLADDLDQTRAGTGFLQSALGLQPGYVKPVLCLYRGWVVGRGFVGGDHRLPAVRVLPLGSLVQYVREQPQVLSGRQAHSLADDLRAHELNQL